MDIRLKYFGQLRKLTGARDETVAVGDGASLTDVLKQLIDQYGDGFGEIVLDSQGKIRGSLVVTINDESVLRGEVPELKAGDEVALMTAIAGG